MLFALAAFISIQSGAALESGPPPDQTVVVTARRKRLTAILGTLLPASQNAPLARYEVPVCPGVSGAPASAAATLLELIRENGERAGIELAPPGCDANALVIFSNAPDAVVARMRLKVPAYFGLIDTISRQRLSSGGAPIRSWHAVETIGRAGEALDEAGAAGTGARTARFARASRIVENTLPAMAMGFVIVDTNAITGKTLQQLADITSMHLYLDLAPTAAAKVEPGSILTLFQPRDEGVAAPSRMNTFDRGVLRGAYAGTNSYQASFQRSRIAQAIAVEQVRGATAGQED